MYFDTEKKIYNEDLKKRFIENCYRDRATQINVWYTLAKAYGKESRLDKDLYDFTPEEINDLFYAVEATSLQSISKDVSIFSNYIDFAIKEGYGFVGFNHIKANPIFSGKELEKYVSKIHLEQKYISADDLMHIAGDMTNAQDAVTFLLLFEGIRGEQLHEIRALKMEHIDKTNRKIKLYEKDGTTRVKEASQQLIDLLIEADNEEVYKRSNGNDIDCTIKQTDLPQTGYILRPSVKDFEGMMKSPSIARRIKNISSIYNNPYLTATSIWESGMIEYAKQMIKDRDLKELDRKHYEEINEWAGRSIELWYNTKRVVSKFI